MGRYKFENLLMVFLISKQRKKMSSENQPECAFYKKNRPECAFSLYINFFSGILRNVSAYLRIHVYLILILPYVLEFFYNVLCTVHVHGILTKRVT